MIYTIANQKGGVAKTTTTSSVISGLAKKGYKVLGIDLDPQKDLSYVLKASDEIPSIKDALAESFPQDIDPAAAKDFMHQVIQNIGENIDFIRSDANLRAVTKSLSPVDAVMGLKMHLKYITDEYDYIVIDTPPNLEELTTSALIAADAVIIPAFTDAFSLRDTQTLVAAIDSARLMNPNLKIEGILITRFTTRKTNISAFFVDQFSQYAQISKSKVFNTKIREGVKMQEAQFARQSVYDYDANSTVAKDYTDFVEELING